MTFNDLETNTSLKLEWFWHVIWILLIESEIWPFLPFLIIADLAWPFLTSRLLFFKCHVKSFIFRYIKFFSLCSKFDPICSQMSQNNLRAFPQITINYLDRIESFQRILRKNNHAVIFLTIKPTCYSEVSYFSSAVKFKKLFWKSFLNSIKSKADSQIFKNFCSQGVSEI